MLSGGEGGEVRADLRGDHQCGTGTDGGDRGEVDAHHLVQRQGLDALLAGVVACGVRRAARRGVRGRAGRRVRHAAARGIVRRCQTLDLSHHPGLAVVDLRVEEVIALHGLFEGEQVFLAPRPLKARGDGIGVGLDAPVEEPRQALRVTLAVDDRAQDALAGQSRDVGDHRVEPDVHLGQRLLHMQDAAGAVLGQPPHLACVGAQRVNLRRPDGTRPAAGRRTSAARSTGSPARRSCARRSASSCAAARASPRSPRAPASRRPQSSRPEVDSIATLVTPHDLSHAAIASRSRAKAPNERTGSSVRSGSTATKCRSLPMSIPAQSGFTTLRRRVLRDLRAMEHPPAFRLRCERGGTMFEVPLS